MIAASRITHRPTERIETDRRDALTLARLGRSGDLVRVVIPDERDEAMRDLSRAREDALRARLKARQQLKALLLRHGRHYRDKGSWTLAHERYLASVSFAHTAQNIAFAEYRQAATEANQRVHRLTEALRVECEQWRMKPVVAALSALRGIDFIAAVTLVAEIGDFAPFRPSQRADGLSRPRTRCARSPGAHNCASPIGSDAYGYARSI